MKKVLTGNKFTGGHESGAKSFARRLACLLLLTAYCLPLTVLGQYAQPPQRGVSSNDVPSVLRDIGIEQRLNEQVPLDLNFRDEAGRTV
ncbi:MAG TPA: hypothetical protein VEZ40_17555, partial [Pyrinomonadaceae bacterium]|nr:hypothetical protein [Pyrinomonadaceae bacterium]